MLEILGGVVVVAIYLFVLGKILTRDDISQKEMFLLCLLVMGFPIVGHIVALTYNK